MRPLIKAWSQEPVGFVSHHEGPQGIRTALLMARVDARKRTVLMESQISSMIAAAQEE
jgi:hypothetical protein